jgi:NTE family protein
MRAKLDFGRLSIGAINSAIIAGNGPEKRLQNLETFWSTVSGRKIWAYTPEGDIFRDFRNQTSSLMTLLFGQPGFFQPRLPNPWLHLPGAQGATSYYDSGALQDTLEKLIDFDLLNDGRKRLSVGAVNVRTGNFVYFDTEKQRIGPEHIMASGALPPALPAVKIDGEYYWDGGIVSNTPLQYVLDVEVEDEDCCVFQIDLFSARGELPATLLEIAQREKDIRYSSRTRLNTDMMCQQHRLRAAIKRLGAKLSAELRDDPDWRALEERGRESATTIVHLIHRRGLYESASKDYEFSRATMERNWMDGRKDVEKTLSHPQWINRDRPQGAVKIFDLTQDAPPTK